MIAARLATTSLKFRPASGILFRSFKSESNQTVRRSFRSRFQNAASAETTISNTPIKVGQMALAGASVLGLGSLAFYGLGSSKDGALDRSAVWPQYIRDRISSTYQYFGASLGITAASAYAVSQNPALMRLATSGGMMVNISCLLLKLGIFYLIICFYIGLIWINCSYGWIRNVSDNLI